MRRGRWILLCALLAGCAGGSDSGGPPAQSASRRAAPPPVRSIAVSPADYVARASSASLFIIKASEIVGEREGPTALGNVARRFRADHQGVSAQLSFAGRRLNLLPSAALLPAHQAMLDSLAASGTPGRTYIAQMKTVLPQALALHDQYRRLGTSATLRPVAAMATPVVSRELQSIRRL
jgi:predicted outer membrane protein